jgi:hypothetical protein
MPDLNFAGVPGTRGVNPFRARVREGKTGKFHGLFYGLTVFRCKTAQFCATLCES